MTPAARKARPWLAVAALTLGLTVVTSVQAIRRYRDLRTGWSWDLAYYNQWLWALTKGDGRITVRPIAPYATEGPMVWQTNYLSPVRLALVPIYALAPDPRTLLVVHAVVFWWVVPAAFTLVKSETGSDAVALAAAFLVPLTPLLWPLAWNDFRELQLAVPFALWAVQAVRSRSLRVAALGIGGMLACRQEFAVATALLATLPPRRPEDVGRTYRWVHALIVLGAAWLLLGFFGYLRLFVSSVAPLMYLQQFKGDSAPVGQTLETSFVFLTLGLGAWSVFLIRAPRAAFLMVPWLYYLAGGRWSLRYLSTEQWHHVRYTAPFAAFGLAAGLIGFGRVGSWVWNRPGGGVKLAAVWLAAAAVSTPAVWNLVDRMNRQPRPVEADEARALWAWIDRVRPTDAVLAAYEVSAPLSSRAVLYSYPLMSNRPYGYPILPGEVRWVFFANADGGVEVFERQGFEAVHRGRRLTVLRRAGIPEE